MMDNRAQVSAELIIVIAALLAVAMVFVQSLSSTVEQASKRMNHTAKSVLDKIDAIK